MKNFLILFICIFTLSSCFSNKNAENLENNSWNTVSVISENKEIQEEKSEMLSNKSNCKRFYDFAIGENYKVDSYRQFEFNFIWDCSPQKKSIQIDDILWEWFKVESGQQALFTNFLMLVDFGGPVWCIIKNQEKTNVFNNGNFHITINGWEEVCMWYDLDNIISEGKKQIFIWVKEENKKILSIQLAKIDPKDFEKNYNDLLWTMQNGFFETDKNFSEKEIVNIKHAQKIEQKNTITWTKENLAKAQFIRQDDGYSILWFIENTNFDIQAYIDPLDINPYWWCEAGRRKSECIVEKIDNDFIYWKNFYLAKDSFDGENIFSYTEWEVSLKTDIRTGKTEIINKKEDSYCYDEEKWKKTSCE